MDNEYYTDSFEQLLKQQADRFTMQPTKRVWHSIYNDLHPARKWPSIAISGLLVISLLLLGYLNTNNSGKQKTNASLANDANNTPDKQAGTGQQRLTTDGATAGDNTTIAGVGAGSANVAPVSTTIGANSNLRSNTVLSPVPSNGNLPRRTSRLSSVKAIQHNKQQQKNDARARQSANSNTINATTGAGAEQTDNNPPVSNDKNITVTAAQSQIKMAAGNSENLAPATNTGGQVADADNSLQQNAQKNDEAVTAPEQKMALQQPTVIDNIDRAWIDDHAFYNKPRRGKLKNRLSWEAYITPSFTYRTLFENSIAEGRTSLQSLVTNPFARQAGIENSVDHKPGPSLELGGALAYQLAKKWQLKLGVQVNYTSYYATANNIRHPITTSIAVNNLANGSLDIQNHSASISNTPGSNNDKLNNYSVQLALPIGFAYKLAGKDDLKFYFGATLQPSFILAGSSPLLSSDRLFYVDNNTKQGDASFMRRFNVAMGIETFASFRMGEYTFLAGPQLRYQLFTTNSNRYTIGEKLYNVGVKLGVSKKF
jgi:hypothetical protein